MTDTLDLTFLGKQLERVLTRATNAETLALQNIEYSRRLERQMDNLGRRLSEQKDDLELIVKAEIMGRLGHFEVRMERLIDEKLDTLRSELPGLIADALRQVLTERGS